MSAYECWLAQRERLRESLATASDSSGAAYLTRHALAQVEQNVMAEQSDELLRQQTGILFACCKTSLNLLELSVDTRVWVERQQLTKPKKRPLAWALPVAVALQATGTVLFALSDQALLSVPLAIALLATVSGWITLRRASTQEAIPEDRLQVTARPKPEKLFAALDAQMQAIDRYIHDFTYLNEQQNHTSRTSDAQSLSALSSLMEAVYDWEGDAQQDALSASHYLLESLGARAVDYQPDVARLFTVLPSLGATRTLAPAIVAQKDGALLARGAAAVGPAVAALPDADESVPTPKEHA